MFIEKDGERVRENVLEGKSSALLLYRFDVFVGQTTFRRRTACNIITYTLDNNIMGDVCFPHPRHSHPSALDCLYWFIWCWFINFFLLRTSAQRIRGFWPTV